MCFTKTDAMYFSLYRVIESSVDDDDLEYAGFAELQHPRGFTTYLERFLLVTESFEYHPRILIYDLAHEDGPTLVKAFGGLSSSSDPAEVLHGPVDVLIIYTEIFVLDERDCRVVVFGLDGKFIRSFGKKGKSEGKLNAPKAFTTDAKNEYIYIADSGLFSRSLVPLLVLSFSFL
jgi:hypothetical protein